MRQRPAHDESTPLNAWRFSSIMATAVTMTAAVAHAMELVPKLGYEPPLYVRLHRTLYPPFGRIAGPAEAMAVAATATLAWWTRTHRPRTFPLTGCTTLQNTPCAIARQLAAALTWSVLEDATDDRRDAMDRVPLAGAGVP